MESRLQRITSVTTKVRRLGYFVLFSKVLSRESLAAKALRRKILSDFEQNHKLLLEVCTKLPTNRKGEKSVTGEITNNDAFNRYLGSAKEFGLVQELSERLYNTKRGEILLALSNNENFFRLSIPQIHLMWRIILEKDFDYMRNVVECTLDHPSDEETVFVSRLKKYWQQKLSKAASTNVGVYEDLKLAIDTAWKSPKRYYRENIKAPRLEWILDLNAIEYWHVGKNRVTFRRNIMTLLDSNKLHFTEAFLCFMEPVLNKSKTYWNEITQPRKDKLLDELLSKSFTLFKTRNETPKISGDQFLEFGVTLLSDSGIVCEIGELEQELEKYTKKTGKRRYVRISSEADSGYITEL